MTSKEKEFTKTNHESYKKVEKLYKTLNECKESNQNNKHEIEQLKTVSKENQKTIELLNQDRQKTENEFHKVLFNKDQKIQELLNLKNAVKPAMI